MRVDTENSAVRLCLEGMRAEMGGQRDRALELYLRAWNDRADGFEGCIAAHYIAKLQVSPEDTHRWNALALRCALEAGDERVRAFYPSLHLNLGKSCEDLGLTDDAKRHYELADEAASVLPDDGLGNLTRQGNARGKQRIGG